MRDSAEMPDAAAQVIGWMTGFVRAVRVNPARNYEWLNVHEAAGKFGYHPASRGTVAQLVEQGPFKALVLGSSPSRPTYKSMS
jgi:hypothetical protein